MGLLLKLFPIRHRLNNRVYSPAAFSVLDSHHEGSVYATASLLVARGE